MAEQRHDFMLYFVMGEGEVVDDGKDTVDFLFGERGGLIFSIQCDAP